MSENKKDERKKKRFSIFGAHNKDRDAPKEKEDTTKKESTKNADPATQSTETDLARAAELATHHAMRAAASASTPTREATWAPETPKAASNARRRGMTGAHRSRSSGNPAAESTDPSPPSLMDTPPQTSAQSPAAETPSPASTLLSSVPFIPAALMVPLSVLTNVTPHPSTSLVSANSENAKFSSSSPTPTLSSPPSETTTYRTTQPASTSAPTIHTPQPSNPPAVSNSESHSPTASRWTRATTSAAVATTSGPAESPASRVLSRPPKKSHRDKHRALTTFQQHEATELLQAAAKASRPIAASASAPPANRHPPTKVVWQKPARSTRPSILSEWSSAETSYASSNSETSPNAPTGKAATAVSPMSTPPTVLPTSEVRPSTAQRAGEKADMMSSWRNFGGISVPHILLEQRRGKAPSSDSPNTAVGELRGLMEAARQWQSWLSSGASAEDVSRISESIRVGTLGRLRRLQRVSLTLRESEELATAALAQRWDAFVTSLPGVGAGRHRLRSFRETLSKETAAQLENDAKVIIGAMRKQGGATLKVASANVTARPSVFSAQWTMATANRSPRKEGSENAVGSHAESTAPSVAEVTKPLAAEASDWSATPPTPPPMPTLPQSAVPPQKSGNIFEYDGVGTDFCELFAIREPIEDFVRKRGLHRWRIDKLLPSRVLAPGETFEHENTAGVDACRHPHNHFYAGDCYLVLYVTGGSNAEQSDSDTAASSVGEATLHLHYWIGKEATIDKIGAVAFRAVQLNCLLGNAAKHYHEEMDAESDRFLSYFAAMPTPGDSLRPLVYLPGGTECGFRHVRNVDTTPRLYRFYLASSSSSISSPSCTANSSITSESLSSSATPPSSNTPSQTSATPSPPSSSPPPPPSPVSPSDVRFRRVPLSARQLCHRDTYVLELADRLFVWRGARSPKALAFRAADMMAALNAGDRRGRAAESTVDAVDEDAAGRPTVEFWQHLADVDSVPPGHIPDETPNPLAQVPIKLFCIKNDREGGLDMDTVWTESVDTGSGRPPKALIANSDDRCFIVDAASDVFAFYGKRATPHMRQVTAVLAERFVTDDEFRERRPFDPPNAVASDVVSTPRFTCLHHVEARREPVVFCGLFAGWLDAAVAPRDYRDAHRRLLEELQARAKRPGNAAGGDVAGDIDVAAIFPPLRNDGISAPSNAAIATNTTQPSASVVDNAATEVSTGDAPSLAKRDRPVSAVDAGALAHAATATAAVAERPSHTATSDAVSTPPTSQSPLSEEMKLWLLDGSTPIGLPRDEAGVFYGGDSYMAIHCCERPVGVATASPAAAVRYTVYVWEGKDAGALRWPSFLLGIFPELERKLTARGLPRPQCVRVRQHSEPPAFLRLFSERFGMCGRVVVRRGHRRTALANEVRALARGDVDTAPCRLFQVRSVAVDEGDNKPATIDYMTEIECDWQSLHAASVYVLCRHPPDVDSRIPVFVWRGSVADGNAFEGALRFAKHCASGDDDSNDANDRIEKPATDRSRVDIVVVDQGRETAAFWRAVGMSEDEISRRLSKDTLTAAVCGHGGVACRPRLARIGFDGGKLAVAELSPFSEHDLHEDGVFIVDNGDTAAAASTRVFLWIGRRATPALLIAGRAIAGRYAQFATGAAEFTEIREGEETREFTRNFTDWTRRTFVDPYEVRDRERRERERAEALRIKAEAEWRETHAAEYAYWLVVRGASDAARLRGEGVPISGSQQPVAGGLEPREQHDECERGDGKQPSEEKENEPVPEVATASDDGLIRKADAVVDEAAKAIVEGIIESVIADSVTESPTKSPQAGELRVENPPQARAATAEPTIAKVIAKCDARDAVHETATVTAKAVAVEAGADVSIDNVIDAVPESSTMPTQAMMETNKHLIAHSTTTETKTAIAEKESEPVLETAMAAEDAMARQTDTIEADAVVGGDITKTTNAMTEGLTKTPQAVESHIGSLPQVSESNSEPLTTTSTTATEQVTVVPSPPLAADTYEHEVARVTALLHAELERSEALKKEIAELKEELRRRTIAGSANKAMSEQSTVSETAFELQLICAAVQSKERKIEVSAAALDRYTLQRKHTFSRTLPRAISADNRAAEDWAEFGKFLHGHVWIATLQDIECIKRAFAEQHSVTAPQPRGVVTLPEARDEVYMGPPGVATRLVGQQEAFETQCLAWLLKQHAGL